MENRIRAGFRRFLLAAIVVAATASVAGPMAGERPAAAADFPGPDGITVSLDPSPLQQRTNAGDPGFSLGVSDTNPTGVGFTHYYLGRVPAGWAVSTTTDGALAPFAQSPDGTAIFEIPRGDAAASAVRILPPIGFVGTPSFTISRTAAATPNLITNWDGGTFDFIGEAKPQLGGTIDSDYTYKDPRDGGDNNIYVPADGQYTIWPTSLATDGDDGTEPAAFGWADVRSHTNPMGGDTICGTHDNVSTSDSEDNAKLLVVNVTANIPTPNALLRVPVNMAADTMYDFGIWLANIDPVEGHILPNLTLDLDPDGGGADAVTLVDTGNITRPTGCENAVWRQYRAVFYSAGVSGGTIRVRNNAPGGIGNDIALDDVTFRSMTSATFPAEVVAAPSSLAVTKTVSDATPDYGDVVTYTVIVSNNGVGAAPETVVTDLLPAGLTFVSASSSQGSYNPATGAWSVGTLGAGGAAATLAVSAVVATAQAVTNVVSRVSSPTDPTPCNGNCAQATITPRVADLSVTKVVSDASPAYGHDVTYTVTVTNAGDADATSTVVTDVLPAGLVYVDDSSGGAYNPGTGAWSAGTVPGGGGTRTLELTARVATAVPSTNVVSRVAASEDPTPCSSSCASASLVPRTADLAVTKSVDEPESVYLHDIVFTITATNGGDADATQVQIVDRLPNGLVYMSDDGGGHYQPATGTWDVGTLAAGGGTATLHVVALVTSPGPEITNVVTSVSAVEDPTPCDSGCAQATVDPRVADLVVTKVADTLTPAFNHDVTFTLTVTNVGDADATGAVAVDVLPEGLAYVSDTSDGAYDPDAGIWTVGTVAAANGSESIEIVATVETTDSITNEVSSVSTPEDPTPCTADCASVVLTPRVADLSVAVTVDEPSPAYSHDVVFTITVTNEGDAEATLAMLTGLLPDGLAYVADDAVTTAPADSFAAAAAGDPYDEETGIWAIGAVDPDGGERTFDLTASVGTPDDITFVISSLAALEDPTPCTADCASVELAPRAADLAVTKVADSTSPVYGSNVVFTVEVANRGDADGEAVELVDQLPDGLEYVSDDSDGAYDPATGTWAAGVVDADGGSAQLQLTAKVVTDEPVVNVVTSASTPEDPMPCTEGCASSPLTPRRARLTVTKVVDNAAPAVGSTVTYTITITNAGDADAAAPEVIDMLPAGIDYVSDDAGGQFTSATGVWRPGLVVAGGGSQSLRLVARVASAGELVNVISSVESSEDPDPCAADCASAVLRAAVAGALPRTGSGPLLAVAGPLGFVLIAAGSVLLLLRRRPARVV